MRKPLRYLLSALVAWWLLTPTAHAQEGAGAEIDYSVTFLYIVIVLVIAKLSSLVERIGQPAVLGELVAGVILGNLVLVGIPFFEPLRDDPYIRFLAQLGVVILLFQVGLESDVTEMRRVGIRALLVAVVGVALPFMFGTLLAGPLLLPGLSQNAYLFLGATLTATSVGITARVFHDLGKLQTSEAQIVLGAAVIDDVLGLVILAVVSAIVTVGSISPAEIGFIIVKATLFLAAAIVLGQIFAPRLGQFFSVIHTGTGMKFTLAISFGLLFAYLAAQIGLAPIVGAFAAGLVLDPVHFRFFNDPAIVEDLDRELKHAPTEWATQLRRIIERHANHHVQELIAPIGFLLVPIFFLLTGMDVHLEALLNPTVLAISLGITLIAFIGKIAAGMMAGNANKLIVGVGMIPRGEVGLIFAATGKALNVVNDEVFSIIVIVVILSTLVTPPLLAWLLKRVPNSAGSDHTAGF